MKICGLLNSQHRFVTSRPFRSPHHTISDAGLLGGTGQPAPGEVSLAHNGVLFLDELPEFHRSTLEVMRQPLEDGKVTISRAAKITCNARMTPRLLRKYCALDSAGMELLKEAVTNLNLSARAYDRILKVARTIADLAGAPKIQVDHLAEAIQYRALDRSLW